MRGRWHRELTRSELVSTLQRRDLVVAEWPGMGLTFLSHRPLLRIVRTGALGGDVRDVHGGWLYSNDISFMLDWTEIMYVTHEPINFVGGRFDLHGRIIHNGS